MRILLITLWHYARRWPHLVLWYTVSSIILIGLWVADPLLGRTVIDFVGVYTTDQFDREAFLRLFIIWIAVSLLLSVVQAIHKMVCWRILNYCYIAFHEETFNHVMHMDVMQHIQRRAGAIIKKIDNAADTMWDLGFQIFQVIIPSIIAGAIFLSIAYTVNARMTLIVTVALLFYATVLIIVTNRAHPAQTMISRMWVSIIGRCYDVATNILPVKSAPGEKREMARMRYWHQRGLKLQNRTDLLWGILEGINMFILLRALIVGTGLYFISQGELSLGELFFFIFIIFRLVAPIEVIGAFLPKWNEKIEKVRMGVHMGKLPSMVTSPAHPTIIDELKGEIIFQNVSFSYEGSSLQGLTKEEEEEEVDILDPRIKFHEHEVDERHLPHHELLTYKRKENVSRTSIDRQDAIKEVDLTIRPGEHVALVGHSGAGKSTIASLINRFYDVTDGAILLDGVNVRELDLQWLRKQIGLVLQDNTLFNDTIAANIRYTRQSASDEEVTDAAKRASAHAFITAMPEGYKTGIGERGIKLSGGERQRIAIARAILKNPKIVVLDEATSALDSKTEKDVQEGIRELIEGRTSIIIAHRLSTVRSCHRIAVFDKGHLIACAPHEELLKTCNIYKEMVELQSHGMLAE